MTGQEFIKDTGLFVGQKIFDFSLQESFEEITNLYQTIKEYREFADPYKDSWFDYIHQIFHILGFNTEKVAPRLISLHGMGGSQTPKALVCIIGPHEDFDHIIYGLAWESYLFYAAKYHRVEWVILTNGLQFKVINYGETIGSDKYFMCELDEIVRKDQTDSFFTLYKIFALIYRGSDQMKPKKGEKRKLAPRHHLRREFWTELIARSKNKTALFKKRKPGINSYISIGAGKSGLSYGYLITSNEGARIQMYIDNGDKNWNKNAFDTFQKNREEIEKSFGESIVWDRLDDHRASIIRYHVSDYCLHDRDKWPELHDQMIGAMIRFEKAFRPYISKM